MIQYEPNCGACGEQLVVDFVSDDGGFSQTNVPIYNVPQGGAVTRCYCSRCGIMYHPERVGATVYTTPTKIQQY